MKTVIDMIKGADKILLSTHRQCDGDGLGAELALFFALQKMKKKVKIVNVDETPRKYRFLEPDKHIHYFNKNSLVDLSADLCLIFDTNDERLIGELYPLIERSCKNILFIDHHPILSQGPQPTAHSIIDVSAASTGEIVYQIIKQLDVDMDRNIARALYTSITFDTQLYRFVRNSANSHLIAAELLKYSIEPEEVHRYLFGNQTVNKMAFLATVLNQIEYYANETLAILRFRNEDLMTHQLELDDSRDVIDLIMNIETLEAAAIFREDGVDQYKVSLRSKNKLEVLSVAENLGGGGHRHAAGAFIKGNYELIKEKVVLQLSEKLKNAT